MTPYEQAWAFVAALAGDPATAVIDWRALHDQDRGIEGHARRGTLPAWWSWLCDMNSRGYGIFANINEMDGQGRHLANVRSIRTQVIDLDNLSAQQNMDRAAVFTPAPSFMVNTSPGKFHVYWPVASYVGNDRYKLLQRKLRQLFDGDGSVIDPTRVMRVPGFYHCKTTPHLVTCGALGGYGQPLAVETLEAYLAGVNVIDSGSGGRKELGAAGLEAPSIDWLKHGLSLVDPNGLDRASWIALTCAFKQAGWSLTDEATLRAIWEEWCAGYDKNDKTDNEKQWASIGDTELGWGSFLSRIPSLKAQYHLGGHAVQAPAAMPGTPVPVAATGPATVNTNGEFLNDIEQRVYFKDCTYVVNLGEMLVANGRFLNTSQFNATFGGKNFIINSDGKTTNEPWAAATRSTLWTVPKVDHIRFLPEKPYGEVIRDELGRDGINVYRPATIIRLQGDVSPFLNHMAALIPDENDRRIIIEYMAHNAQYPGFKIPWAPLIQSAEGAGKGVLKAVMRHAMSKPYVYYPKASELAQSGAKFNKWLRNRLFILVDEIKVDERRELIEVLKPLISEEDTEIQAKGIDQDLEDNFSNWFFFSNWKDAIPVNINGRRFAIVYSPLQTAQDLIARGMNEDYFKAIYAWLKGENGYPHGAAIVADYLMSYPIARGGVPMRAPVTSSTEEARRVSRSPLERMIAEAVEDGLPGFMGGWISLPAAVKRSRDVGIRNTQASVVESVLKAMGYFEMGRAPRAFLQEKPSGSDVPTRSHLFNLDANANVENYGRAQNFE